MRFARSEVDFAPQLLSSAAGGSGAAAAAGVVDVGNSFASMRNKAPKYDQLSATAMANDSAVKQAGMAAEASVMSAGIQSLGQAKSSQMMGRAQIESAKAQAEASKQSSMFGAIGGIASAGLKLFTGGLV